eukprot:jgi/Botrbrau1/5442/Bobra.182_1s0044.1
MELTPSSLLPRVTGSITVSRVHISGRCTFRLHLKANPGVAAVDFCFAEQPHLELDVQPFGVVLSQVPGLQTLLQKQAQRALAKSLVHPIMDRSEFRSKWIYQDAANAGGLVYILTVIGAEGLRDKTHWCEVRCGGERFCTRPLVGSTPRWNHEMLFHPLLSLPRSASEANHEDKAVVTSDDPGGVADIRIKVMMSSHSSSTSIPRRIGVASIKLSDFFQPGERGGAPTSALRLPLKGVKGATVQLQFAEVRTATRFPSLRQMSKNDGSMNFGPKSPGRSAREAAEGCEARRRPGVDQDLGDCNVNNENHTVEAHVVNNKHGRPHGHVTLMRPGSPNRLHRRF